MKNFKTFCYSIYLDFLSFIRVKIAVFFSLIFPIMLFLIFGNIWGNGSKEYIFFLFTGLICLITISEGLFSIGPVVKDFYSSGWIKFIRTMPLGKSFFFSSFIFSRIIFFEFVIFVLALISHFYFDVNPFPFYHKVIISSFLGFIVFSNLGLIVSLWLKDSSSRAVSNFLYFILIFISDIFYNINKEGSIISYINSHLPVNNLVNYMRGNEMNWLILIAWIIFPVIILKCQFKYGNFTNR